MRTRALILAVSTLWAAPAGAQVAVYGSLGASYLSSSRQAEGVSSETHTVDFAGDVTVGAPIAPGLLDLDGTAFYRGSRSGGDSSGRSDAWGYRLNAGLMRASDHPVLLSGSREWSEFTSGGAGTHTGTLVLTTYAASADYHPASAPGLTAVLSRSETENRTFGSPDSGSASTGLSLLAYQSVPDLWYRIQYGTSWSEGTGAENNFRGHDLSAAAEMVIAPGVNASMSGAYSLRGPTLASPLNPRYDGQSLAGGVSWAAGDGSTTGIGYSYANSVTSIFGEDPRSSTAHAASASHTRRLAEHWTLSTGTGAAISDVEAPAGRRHSTTENVSSTVNWNQAFGRVQAHASASASVGASQVPDMAGRGAYGGGLSGGLSGPLGGTWSASGSYGFSYGSNLGGSGLSTLGQSLSLSLSGPSVLGGRLGASVVVGGRRTDNELLGVTGSRTLTFNLTSTWRVTTVNLQAGFSDGLSAALMGSVAGDGLFLPLDYNTHSRYATLQASTSTRFGLSLSGVLRHVSVDAPGQGNRWENGAGLYAGYGIGAWSFRLEDTLSRAGGPLGSGTTNVIFLRVTRAFSSTFGY